MVGDGWTADAAWMRMLLCEQVMGPGMVKVCPGMVKVCPAMVKVSPAKQVPVTVNGRHRARMQKKKTSRSTGYVAVKRPVLESTVRMTSKVDSDG